MRTHRRTLLLLGVYLSLTGHFLISDAVTLLLQSSKCDAGRGARFPPRGEKQTNYLLKLILRRTVRLQSEQNSSLDSLYFPTSSLDL
jgi:hypothetical protein